MVGVETSLGLAMQETFTFDDILIKPRPVSSIESRNMVDTKSKLYDVELAVPVMSASMSVFDTVVDSREIYFSFASALSEAGGVHIFSRATLFEDRYRAVSSLAATGHVVGIAVSLKEFHTYRDRLEQLPENTIVSIDIANGAIIKDIMWLAPAPLIIGNFGNPNAALRRDLAGRIAFKFGLGSGSGCSTRLTTGVGMAQASLIQETVTKTRKPIISDGGINVVADVVKALALGAEFVMLGRLLAAAKETPWPPVKKDGMWYKEYRGMASAEEKRSSSYIEGVAGLIPYEERSVASIISGIKDGLASAMSYVDSTDLDEFRQKVEFTRVSTATKTENGIRLL